jgi:RND family efflux transporter MFP subunit
MNPASGFEVLAAAPAKRPSNFCGRPGRARNWMFALALLSGSAHCADYPAVLAWSGQVGLTMPVAGVLEQVNVQPGQTVKKYSLLANLNPTLFQAGVAEARADLDRLTEESADAERDLTRVKELYARTVAATTELDAARLRNARAQASLAATQARLEKARRLLVESELRAPFDAIVLARLAEPGQVITIPCQPATVLSVARSDEWLARARVDSSEAPALRLGVEASVRVGEQTLSGRVRALTALVDGHYQLDVAVPRGNAGYVGQSAIIHLP